MANTEQIPDLEIKLGDGYPAVRGGWVNGTTSSKAMGGTPTPISGEIRRIEREIDGAHPGRVLLTVYEPRGRERYVLPENCTSRKPPAEGTIKRSAAKIHAAASDAPKKARRSVRRKA